MSSNSHRNYISNFLGLNPKEKLSVIADIVTILGISIATFVAGPFLTELVGLGFELSEFIWALFFYSIIGLAIIGLIIGFLSEFKNTENKKDSGDTISAIFVYLLILAIFISVYPWTKNFFGDITNNRYLLPPSAMSAVKDIDSILVETLETFNFLKVKLF